VYGTIGEDVWRRDFTCNALYYNIADFSIWDYVGGVKDIERRRLVLIGDPDTRLREDPVRMLRAIRFAAKLDFTIDPSVATSMQKLRDLLSNVPPARLFDEFLKMFQGGFAGKTFELLWKYHLFGKLFPETDAELEKDRAYGRLLQAALINTDKRVAEAKTVTPMFLLGVFLWAPIKRLAAELRETEKMSDGQSLAIASHTVAGWQQSRISIPRRFTGPMAEMLALQPRFENNKGRRALNLLEHKRFRAAYDFMMLRAEVGDFDQELADFWTQAQSQGAEQRLQSFDVSSKAEPHKRRRRPRRKRAGNGAGNKDQ
jgi:poly(A) polymerase